VVLPVARRPADAVPKLRRYRCSAKIASFSDNGRCVVDPTVRDVTFIVPKDRSKAETALTVVKA